MTLGEWLLIETLSSPETWSVLTVGTVPRQWKSLARTVPARLLPVVTAAYDGREPVDRELPRSRHPWSQQRARALPLIGPGGAVHGVLFRVGDAPAAPPPVAPFLMDARTRRTEVLWTGLGPAFDRGRSVWVGAESFEHIERFDGALDLVATVSRAEPGARWLGTCTARTPDGLRTLLVATRNTADPQCWRGLLADVTESVPAQGKSFEAATVDTLVNTNPGLYLAVVDTARIRVIRWISAPLPGLRWTGETDERTLPHPADRPRILAARTDILSGTRFHTIPALRLAATTGDWLTIDVEISPLPYGPSDNTPPQFALVRITLPPAPDTPAQ
ncbi:GAF domain-containing protein [Nocardia wallacei]|uniref:GAF domain-containing protein n=1 Tax=Nocardia wallacei TaxID=480035 RepID=UPI0024581E81|nr:GAF domain-containing protein [Nocardia wallacei]